MLRSLGLIMFALQCLTGFAQKKSFFVKVTDRQGTVYKGKLLMLTDSTLQLANHGTLMYKEIEQIKYRRSGAPITGAVVGLLVGGAAALAIDSSPPPCDPLTSIFCGFNDAVETSGQLFLVTAGTAIGGIIGGTSKKIVISKNREQFRLFAEEIRRRQAPR